MKALENAKYLTARSVIEYVQKNEARAQKVPAFYKFILTLESHVNLVGAAESQAKQSTKGVTLEKNNSKSALLNAIVRLGKVMLAYANQQNDVVLKEKVTSLKTKLSKALQSEFPIKCTDVLSEAKKIKGLLADYGISEETLVTIEAQIAYMDTKTPETKGMKTEKKAGVKTRTDIFSNIDSVLNEQIKHAAEAFVGVDDDFYSNVIETLKITKPSKSSTQIKAVFIGKETQRSIMNLEARVLETNNSSKSDHKGEMIFKMRKSGVYTIEVPLPNGEMKLLNDIAVKRGKTTVVEVPI